MKTRERHAVREMKEDPRSRSVGEPVSLYVPLSKRTHFWLLSNRAMTAGRVVRAAMRTSSFI